MHAIAARFSPQARAEVRRAFSQPDLKDYHGMGVAAPFLGKMCCPIGVALIVDGVTFPYGKNTFMPDSEEIADYLGHGSNSLSMVVAGEAENFIVHHTNLAEQAVAAFSEGDVDLIVGLEPLDLSALDEELAACL